MTKYIPTIGLEIHAELKTKTKMFCRCLNDAEERGANQNICPVCTAQPGSLPVINKEAVKSVLRVGLALKSQLADFTEWDRKNYFYPDIPKGYQISQYKYPLVSGGNLKGVEITRVHLEEDTARSLHDALNGGPSAQAGSLVDFNRAGVPLMELVTEPVITSAKQAGDFARELQLVLRYLGVSEASMEKGQMRVEANISCRPEGQKELGTKVEVKNLNSFRAMERAIEYELKRQEEAMEKGEKIIQSTLGWDDSKQMTFVQREKESSHDYRYFPDPDLPKVYISEIEEFKNLPETLPELPEAKRARYRNDYGIKDEDIESYVTDLELGKYFDDLTKIFAGDKNLIKLASNYLTSDFLGMRKTSPDVQLPSEGDFATLIKKIASEDVSSRGAKEVLSVLVRPDQSKHYMLNLSDTITITDNIIMEKGLLQKHDEGELLSVAEAVIAANPKVFEDFKAGNDKALQFLIGQGMKESKGSANPAVLAKLFQDKK